MVEDPAILPFGGSNVFRPDYVQQLPTPMQAMTPAGVPLVMRPRTELAPLSPFTLTEPWSNIVRPAPDGREPIVIDGQVTHFGGAVSSPASPLGVFMRWIVGGFAVGIVAALLIGRSV